LPAHNLVSCHHCNTVQQACLAHCSFCHLSLHRRKFQGLQHSWCYILTALLLYVPANMLPIMSTSQLGNQTFSTIVGGVVLLWDHESYLIAAIIFIASVLVPLAKFIVLIGLCLCEQFRLYPQPLSKIFAYRVTEFVGRWSMVDVFVVAFLASLIQMGNIMSVYPGPAALAFAGMVMFTMLAANSLDPKLFWDENHD
jgi:paraquat-inducible protein A